jgi:hypothetical protein
MTVREICGKLQTYYADNYAAAVQDRAAFLKDIFPESLDVSFTSALVLELQGKCAQGKTTVGEFIGIQESLAFLGALQRQEVYRKTSRLSRLKSGYAYRKDLGDALGPVATQLNGIGTKTGSEFLDNLGSS